jgi:hypothetical protein
MHQIILRFLYVALISTRRRRRRRRMTDRWK